MKSFLRSTALFLICLTTAIPVLAECPDGKSEVILMTPSGITKTICVSDKALPGIENAAEHSGTVIVAAECPCLNIWDGEPYPEGTVVEGVPPVLPDIFPVEDICRETSNSLTNQYVVTALENGTGTGDFIAAISLNAPYIDECSATNLTAPGEGRVELIRPSGAIFTDYEINAEGQITSAMMEACRRVLEDRDCTFE